MGLELSLTTVDLSILGEGSKLNWKLLAADYIEYLSVVLGLWKKAKNFPVFQSTALMIQKKTDQRGYLFGNPRQTPSTPPSG